ncbi:MAG: acyltransferase family protein [Legionella sp.]|nr:acyltransferase family protein [Legionella sp.]
MKSSELGQSKLNVISTFVSKPTRVKAGYRQDIDGLRAIAVLLVLFYHIFGQGGFFSNGFIGVDVFFVISGYLITCHIVSELESGSFSLKKFYMRRMRRILPAFLFVLIVVCCVGFFLLTPEDLKKLSETALSACLSISNLYFLKYLSVGYFHSDATVLPLLHTWSLGVEEQFYLIWPLTLCLLFYRFPRAIGPITFLFALISLTTYYCLRTHQSFAFYSPVTRAFELLAGAGLAIYWAKLKAPSKTGSFLLCATGLLLIIYLSSYFNEIHSILINSVVVCFSTVLLIYSGKTASTLIHKMLTFNLLTFLGLISYSLYLWHWPIIAYVNYIGLEINEKVGFLVFVSSLILSCISWKYVEEPFRKKYKFGLKTTILLFLIIPSLLVSIFFLSCKFVPNFGFNKISPTITAMIKDYHGPYTEAKCMDAPTRHPSSIESCSVGDLSKKIPSVLIVGDSHAMAFSGMLDIILKNSHLRGYLVTQSGTPFILGDIKNWRGNHPMQRNAFISKMIRNNHYNFVVLGGYWDYYPDSLFIHKGSYSNRFSVLEKGLNKAVEDVLAVGSIPILMLDIPPLGSLPISCGFDRITLVSCNHSKSKMIEIQTRTRDIIMRLASKYPTVRIIDPYHEMCQDNRCVTAIDQTPLYHTNGSNSHLSYAGSTLLGERYLQHIGSPFV